METQRPKANEPIRIKGAYRMISFGLNSRPIFVSHPLFKRLMTSAGGRLPLAGPPRGIDLDISVKLDAEPVWREKEALNKVSDLDNFPIKSLAPGIVYIASVRSVFLFYGNAWFHLDQTLRNKDEVTEDEDGQKRFAKAIEKMEDNRASLTHNR